MPLPFTRYSDRCNPLVRQWKLLVLLRRGPKTLPELAHALGCHERTVRRDIYALQAVPFPITSKHAAGEGVDPWPLKGRPLKEDGGLDQNLWALGAIAEWPRSEEIPSLEIGL